MSTNQQNPTGVIQFGTGRYAERIHYEHLQRIEKEAIEEELVEFGMMNPEVETRAGVPSEALVTTDGHDRVTRVRVISPASMVLMVVKQSLEEGFYDRIQQWVDRDREGVSPSENDEKSRATARQLAKEKFGPAWIETLENLDSSAENWQAIGRRNHLIAMEFAQKHAAQLNPTEQEFNDLCRRLVGAVPWTMEPGQEALEAAAKTNTVLSAALRAYDEWKERHTAVIYEVRSDGGDTTRLRESIERERVVRVEKLCAFQWPTVFHDWQLDHAVRLGTARAIELLKAPSSAESRLRTALAAELEQPDFKKAMPWPKRKLSDDFEPRLIWPAHEETVTDGMAAALAQLVGYLRGRFCPKNEGPALGLIESIEARGRNDLTKWSGQQGLEGVTQEQSPWLRLTPVVIASYVAQVLWCDRIEGETQREISSSTALVTTIHEGVSALWSADTKQRELELIHSDGSSVAWLAVNSTEDAARLFGAGSTLTFQRLIRRLPKEVHALWRRSGRDQADIVIDGGYSGLASLIGARSKKAADEVKRALELGQTIRRQWANGAEANGLWTYMVTPHAPGRPARLTITLSPILRPGYVHELPQGADRILVPVVPLPPLTGRENEHAKQAALQWATMARFAEGRAETAEANGVTITMADWRRMATRAGLPLATLSDVIKSWDGEFLERVGGDRWFLADKPDYAPARKHLLEQARVAATGSRRGKAAAAKKRGEKPKPTKLKGK